MFQNKMANFAIQHTNTLNFSNLQTTVVSKLAVLTNFTTLFLFLAPVLFHGQSGFQEEPFGRFEQEDTLLAVLPGQPVGRHLSKNIVYFTHELCECFFPVTDHPFPLPRQVVSLLRLKHNIRAEVCQLTSCDYIVSNRMAVKRKTASGKLGFSRIHPRFFLIVFSLSFFHDFSVNRNVPRGFFHLFNICVWQQNCALFFVNPLIVLVHQDNIPMLMSFLILVTCLVDLVLLL